MHQRDAIAALSLVHEVGGNEDGHPVAARQLDHQLPEAVASHRVDPRSGLVEDQDFRLVDHRHRQRQTLANAQRQVVGQLVGHLLQVEAPEHFADPCRDAIRRQVEQPGVQHQVLPHAQLGIQGKGLGHVADPATGRHVAGVHRLAEQRARAFAGRQQAGEHLHGGGLAAAVGAEEAEDLPTLDTEADVIDRDEVAETTGQALGLDGDPRRAFALRSRRDHQSMVAGALAFRQQGDERRLEALRPGTLAQLLRRTGGQDLSVVHRHQPVEALGFLHVSGGDQHAHAFAARADTADQLPELVARQRVDAGGRLVEDQQVGIVDQRAAQPELLLHAAGQLARRTLGERRQPGALQQVGDAPLALGLVVAEQPTEEVDVLEHRERRVEVLAQPLGHVGDARADRPAVAAVAHVAIEHADLAILHLPCAGQQRQQAGLADPVRTDQADHAVGRDLQADVVNRTRLAVAQRNAPEARHAAPASGHCGTLICRLAGHSTSGSSRR